MRISISSYYNENNNSFKKFLPLILFYDLQSLLTKLFTHNYHFHFWYEDEIEWNFSPLILYKIYYTTQYEKRKEALKQYRKDINNKAKNLKKKNLEEFIEDLKKKYILYKKELDSNLKNKFVELFNEQKNRSNNNEELKQIKKELKIKKQNEQKKYILEIKQEFKLKVKQKKEEIKEEVKEYKKEEKNKLKEARRIHKIKYREKKKEREELERLEAKKLKEKIKEEEKKADERFLQRKSQNIRFLQNSTPFRKRKLRNDNEYFSENYFNDEYEFYNPYDDYDDDYDNDYDDDYDNEFPYKKNE